MDFIKKYPNSAAQFNKKYNLNKRRKQNIMNHIIIVLGYVLSEGHADTMERSTLCYDSNG